MTMHVPAHAVAAMQHRACPRSKAYLLVPAGADVCRVVSNCCTCTAVLQHSHILVAQYVDVRMLAGSFKKIQSTR